MTKPILCLDFDGVIHSYTSGWKGADVIPDDPVPGAFPFIYIALIYFRVAIYSGRSNQLGGVKAMQKWFRKHAKRDPDAHFWPPAWHEEIEWPTKKPPAFVTIDDRAITLTGTWPDVDDLLTFKPWNKKP